MYIPLKMITYDLCVLKLAFFQDVDIQMEA